MRSAPLNRNEPSLEDRLEQLDQQLRKFETSLRSQQQTHVRARDLELELAGVVERARAVVAELASIGDDARRTAEAAATNAVADSINRVRDFEQRGARILDAYGTAIRAAQQAVARAEARIDAFDERVARELAQAGRDIREAALLIKEGAPKSAEAVSVPAARSRSLLPVLLAAALILGALAAYSLVARMLRDASARAATAERQAHEIQRDANQQVAAINRTAQQANAEALGAAQRVERMFAVLAAPDIQRLPMRGVRDAKGAAGQAVWSSSRGVVITATRLPPLPPKGTYQVWLVTRQDSLSLGQVSPDADGRINAYFDFPPGFTGNPWGFMLSVEPAGGSPRPSRAIVLAS
jgi:hypothetical protein